MPPPLHYTNPKMVVFFGVFLLIMGGVLWWSFSLTPSIKNNNSTSNTPTACTMEAKICPDGSAVGRSGPNCEFAACPDSNVNTSIAKDCLITGCSRQICADSEVTTTCEMKPEYACYASATCELQASGTCGWTMTTALQDCLIQSALPNW